MDAVDPITAHQAEILREWAQEAGQLAAARGLSPAELTNIMPKYLTALASRDGLGAKRQRRIESHLSARLRAGYRLDEVLEELAILGRCVARACGAEGGGGAASDEAARLDAALREDAAAVVESFAEYLREDEQGEKFYLRRLQAMAGETLRGGLAEGARAEHLDAILALIMEATGAQCAAILLHDAASGSLAMTASVGVVEPAARYPLDGADGSFVALVAAHEEATSIPDAAATELAVSDTLRASGIGELLGVRLPMLHELIGVLYVGLAAGRSFTSRQVRRLESLAEHLSLHLDRARLHDALRATILDLQVERDLRERFMSVLAHDLRGPLSVVSVSARVLGADVERLGAHRELPGRVMRNVTLANRMIHDLLDVLRIRAGHGLPLTLAPCDLAAVARSTVEELAALHGGRFVLRSGASVWGVWSADALQRAIWNLATNAVKYGASRTPITVTVGELAAGVEVAVHNEGPAIPAAALASMFQTFTRFAPVDGEERPGWGLGLTMVKSCAEAHGGTVIVESAPERGTTFTLRLPLDARPSQPQGGAG